MQAFDDQKVGVGKLVACAEDRRRTEQKKTHVDCSFGRIFVFAGRGFTLAQAPSRSQFLK